MTDQPRRDPESDQAEAALMKDLRKLYDLLPAGKVLISVTDEDRVDHHILVPIPNSHEAAKVIAFDTLCKGSLLQDAYFTYGMRCASGHVMWPTLPPEFWNEIVKDGDQVKFMNKPPPLNFDAGFESSHLAKFMKLGPSNTIGDCVTVPLPMTYQDAQRFAVMTFYKRYPRTGLTLHIRKEVAGVLQWVPMNSQIEGDWIREIAEVYEKHLYVEIGVNGDGEWVPSDPKRVRIG
jgi:hypothetical protein